MRCPYQEYKWLPPRRLIELLSELPEDTRVVTNYVGNLTIFDNEGMYWGFIDFNVDGSIETILEGEDT